MLAALLIVFREVLEAGLIVGIVLAATEGVRGRGRWIGAGVGGGLLGAGLVALFAQRLSDAFAGSGQELFDAAILAAAVVMLGWHTVWMTRHGRELASEMKALGRTVSTGGKTLSAMALVVAVAILREGSEVVLFLYGIAASGGAPGAMLAGDLGGVALGASLSWVIYRGLLAIPTGKLFSVTNGLLSLLAAGMAGQAAVYLVKAGVAPSLGDEVWDTSAILADDGILGRALHAIAGYSDRPMGLQILIYAVVLAALIAFSRLAGRAPSAARGSPA
ncbi:MAG: FTR1 family protein [Caulobacterales bacterium]|jgi:high-affinity iron transporter